MVMGLETLKIQAVVGVVGKVGRLPLMGGRVGGRVGVSRAVVLVICRRCMGYGRVRRGDMVGRYLVR